MGRGELKSILKELRLDVYLEKKEGYEEKGEGHFSLGTLHCTKISLLRCSLDGMFL